MRTAFLLLLAAVAIGLGVAWGISVDPGYVRISIGHTLIESTAWVALGAVLLFWIVLSLLIGSTRWTTRHGRQAMDWLRHGGSRRARRLTTQGLLALAEGEWARAQRLLTRAAPRAETPLINYLAAAQASYELQRDDDTDALLRKAYESTSGAELAVGLTQAQLQLGRNQLEQCLATLLRLQRKNPHHRFVLKLLRTVYVRLEDWQALSELLPELRKHEIIPAAELDQLERDAWRHLFSRSAEDIRRQPEENRDFATLNRLWDSLPTSMRRDDAVIYTYAHHLSALGAEAQAETLLRKVLKAHWSDQLIALYGRIRGESVDEQLLAAENWLRERPNNGVLLLALGRLSLRNELWGKGREYLEASVKMGRTPENVAELGRLLAHLGYHEASASLFMEGLLHQAGLPKLPMPRASEMTERVGRR